MAACIGGIGIVRRIVRYPRYIGSQLCLSQMRCQKRNFGGGRERIRASVAQHNIAFTDHHGASKEALHAASPRTGNRMECNR